MVAVGMVNLIGHSYFNNNCNSHDFYCDGRYGTLLLLLVGKTVVSMTTKKYKMTKQLLIMALPIVAMGKPYSYYVC